MGDWRVRRLCIRRISKTGAVRNVADSSLIPATDTRTKRRLRRKWLYPSRLETCQLLISVPRVREPESSSQVERPARSAEASHRVVRP